jgi:hypothetical protein
VPVLAILATVKVRRDVPDPGAAMEVGLKLPVTPEGKPEAVSAITELNPPLNEVVTVTYPLCPWMSDPDVGETEIVKLAATGAVTVRFTVVVSIVAPEVPVIVMGYVPVVAVVPTVNVSVALPAPVIVLEGLKLAVTPEGSVEVVSATAESNPPVTDTVIVELPKLPCTTDTELGDADKL